MTDDQQLSDYLLGELDPEARRRMERRIAEDPELRARAESLSPLVSSLQALPPVAWEAIGADRGEPKSTPAPAPHRFRRLTPRVAIALATAAIVLFAAGIGAGMLLERGSGPSGAKVALDPLPGQSSAASGTARVNGSERLDLVVTGLPRNAGGSYYEAWLMSSTTKLVPIASFTVDSDGRAHLQLTLPEPASSYRYIDISRQLPRDGTAHSGDSVLRGAT
jgi:anti-sigma-K factor RskA